MTDELTNAEMRDIVEDAKNNPDDPVYGFTTKGAVVYLTILLDRLEAAIPKWQTDEK